jgi:integrase
VDKNVDTRERVIMGGSVKLTDKMASQASAPERGNRIIYDSAVKGFGLRLTPDAARPGKGRHFILTYRIEGRQRRMTIGKFLDSWTVGAAREQAKKLKRQIDRGIDPLAERQKAASEPTVRDLAEDFLQEHVAGLRDDTRSAYTRYIQRDIVPTLGTTKVKDLLRADVRRLHRKVSARSSTAANRCLAVLSALMSYAIEGGHRGDNPCKRVKRNQETARRRYLSQTEVARVAEVLSRWPDQNGADALRLLLFTGARKGEVQRARWEQFDLAAMMWRKPASATKQKRVHEIPLAAPAAELLARMRAAAPADAVFLFPSPDRQGQPRGDLSHVWPRVAKAAGVENARLHDLRHSHASALVSSGVSLPMVGALLGHSSWQTTLRYAHLHSDPLRQAAERGATFLTAATNGGPGAEVRPLSRGAK